jgi:hypothetical protein
MAEGIIKVAPDNAAGKAVDTSELLRADSAIVQRQRVAIGDPGSADRLAPVQQQATTGAEPGLVVREADPTVRELLEILLVMHQQLISRSPLPDGTGRIRTVIEAASTAGRYPIVYPSDIWGGAYQATLTPFHLSASAAGGLYQQIIVS